MAACFCTGACRVPGGRCPAAPVNTIDYAWAMAFAPRYVSSQEYWTERLKWTGEPNVAGVDNGE